MSILSTETTTTTTKKHQSEAIVTSVCFEIFDILIYFTCESATN